MSRIIFIIALLMGIVVLIFNACSSYPSHPDYCGDSSKAKKSISYKIYNFNNYIALLYNKPLDVVIGNIKNKTAKEAPIKDITSSLKYTLDITPIVSTKNTSKDYTLDIDIVDLDTVDLVVSITLRFILKDKSGKNIKNIIKKIIYKKKVSPKLNTPTQHKGN